MDKPEIKVRNAFNLALARISHLYPEPENRSIIELVLRSLLDCSRVELYQRFDTNLSNSQQIRLGEIVIELEKYKPIQYILGETEFYGLLFIVGPGILIPRHETEELVEWIVNDFKNKNSLKILDIGTGSGCIAVALAKNLATPEIYATDVSDEALEYARQNAALNNCKIYFLRQDIFSIEKIMPENYDIIVSNPPYVPESDKHTMQANVLEYEPRLALFVPDSDPLLFYKRILDLALIAGKPGGKVYFEIYEKYGEKIQELFEMKGFEEISIRKDIHGKNRVAAGKIPSKI
jgi:release factor glutamine methyltransferase